MPASMSGVDRRVASARSTYDRAGYTATSHHLTSIAAEQSAPDRARVSAHLQAWHVRKDGATVLGLGTWAVDARNRLGMAHRRGNAGKPPACGYSKGGVGFLRHSRSRNDRHSENAGRQD
jgi:hypothetical protein